MFSVDSHIHVNLGGMSLKDIIRYLDKEKIDLCWLLSWEEINPGHWEYKHLTIESVYEAYLKYPLRLIPFYAPDPHKKQASAELNDWYQRGIRGCGELKATLNWNSIEINTLLKTIEKLRLPLVFHMEESRYYEIPYTEAIFDKIIFYGLRTKRKIYQIPKYFLRLLVNNYAPIRSKGRSYYFPGYMLDFASLESSLIEYPNINFVAHGLMFWKYISSAHNENYESLPKGPINGEGVIWRLLRQYPNLYADLSGPSGINALTRDPQNAKTFLSQFQSKILYGTDNCMNGQRSFIDSLNLSEEAYKNIYGLNANKLVKL